MMMNNPYLISSTIENLRTRLSSEGNSVLKDFWKKIEEEGTPIIEPIDNDYEHQLVTFIYRGDENTKNIVVICALADQDDVISNNVCERLDDTNLFFKSFKVLKGTRTIYTFSKNNTLRYPRFYDNLMAHGDTLVSDPYNSEFFIQRYRREGHRFEVKYSVLEMPDAKPQRWAFPRHYIAPGSLKEFDFESKFLDESRKIWVYLPPGYKKSKVSYHFLVVFDGKAFIDFTQAPIIYDNLIAENKIPPVVSVFVHNFSGFIRGKDLSCYPPFADFIAKELLPWVHDKYNISTDPKNSVLIGSSSGGLAASFIAYRYPNLFRKILSQSGWYGWYPGYDWFQYSIQFYGKDYIRWWTKEDELEPEWLTKQFYKKERLPIKFYINVGNLETRAIPHVRNFKNMLEEKGYKYYYEEYPGGHEYIAWREYLPEGLIYLIGNE